MTCTNRIVDLNQFIQSIDDNLPPEGIGILARALWFDGKGEWEKSHGIIQDLESRDAARIHAYLHRKEGDLWNADYWYRKANAHRPSCTLREEWEQLAILHLP